MLRDALTYPLRGPDPEAVFLPGLVVSFAAALAAELPLPLSLLSLVPVTLLVGYLGRVLAAGIDGAEPPPAFGSPTEVAVRGVALVALGTVYLLPAGLALAVTLQGAVAGSVDPGSLTRLGTLRVLAGATALSVFVGGALYLVPAAAGAALSGEGVRDGLALAAVARRTTDGAYFVSFWAAFALLAAAVGAGSLLSAALGRLGSAVGVAATFYALVAAAYLVGRGLGTDGPLYELL
jgi:hypothetical protein